MTLNHTVSYGKIMKWNSVYLDSSLFVCMSTFMDAYVFKFENF